MIKHLVLSLMLLCITAPTIEASQNDSEQCSLDYSILYLIAMNERHKDRDIGYQYLISFNNKNDVNKAKEKFKGFLDNRTIDCKNRENCIKIAKYLISNNIKNLDMGPFQINYLYHKYSLSEYFDLKKSYKNSCMIAQNFIDNDHITFSDIARYHSSTRKYNQRYASYLKRNYNSLIGTIKKQDKHESSHTRIPE